MTLESIKAVPSSATSVGAFRSVEFRELIDVPEQRDWPVRERNSGDDQRSRHASHVRGIEHSDQLHEILVGGPGEPAEENSADPPDRQNKAAA
jgi:hypothetical protein